MSTVGPWLAAIASGAIGVLVATSASADFLPIHSALSPYGPPRSGMQGTGIYQTNQFLFEGSVPCERLLGPQGQDASGENAAWLGAPVIVGLLDMYKATGDVQYLDELTKQADRILECRMDHVNPSLQDTHRLQAMPAWPTYNYTPPIWPGQQRVSYAVHSGYIVYAIARFTRLVFENEQGLSAFVDKAAGYVPQLKESLDAFDSERANGIYFFPKGGPNQTGRAWYEGDSDEPNSFTDATGMPLPVNMQAAMGLAYTEMQAIFRLRPELGDEATYQGIASALATYVRNQFVNGPHDWRYWRWSTPCEIPNGTVWDPNADYSLNGFPEQVLRDPHSGDGQLACPNNSIEDPSHGALVVQFAVAAFLEGIGSFSLSDMHQLSSILLTRVCRVPALPNQQPTPCNGTELPLPIRGTVDGSDDFDLGNSGDLVSWVELARFDPRVFTFVRNLLERQDVFWHPGGPTCSAGWAGYTEEHCDLRFDRDYRAYAAMLNLMYSPDLSPLHPAVHAQPRILLGDFDGDAATDVLQHIEGVGWRFLISDGDAFKVGFASEEPYEAQPFVGDFSGDGKADLAQYTAGGWRVMTTQAPDMASEKHRLNPSVVWSTAGSGIAGGPHTVGDFHYTGSLPHLDDIAYHTGVGWRVLRSTGSSFVADDWSVAGPGVSSTHRSANIYNANSFGQDLVYYTGSAWRSLLSWNYSGVWRFDDYTSAATPEGVAIHVGDLSGDGRDDVLRYRASGPSGSGWYVLASSSYDFPGWSWSFVESRWSSAGMGEADSSLIGDFDYDNRLDLAYYIDISAESGWRVLLSSGSAFGDPNVWTPAGRGNVATVGDFNADGRADIFQYVDVLASWRLLKSTGASFGVELWHGQRGR